MKQPSHNHLNIEVVSDEKRLFELGEDWNSFLDQCECSSVFMTWEYLSNWWKAYGHRFQLHTVLIHDAESNELIGVAPLMIGRGHTYPRKAFRHLTFLGGLGDSLAEYQDFIIRPGKEDQFFSILMNHLFAEEKKWDVISFPLIDESSSTLIHLVEEFPKLGTHVVQLSSRPSPHITLPPTWQDFISSKSKNFKKQFNNHWNRLHKKHELEWLDAGKDIDVQEALEIVSDLNKERWGEKGDTFKSEEFNTFHHSLAESFAAKGWLYLRLLKVDGKFAAARYDFLYGNKLWNYQNGWLPELSHLSLGKMMIGDCVKWCIDQGIREYDFLAGDTDYKKSWSTASRQLMTIEVTNPGSRKALAFQQLRRIKNYMDKRAS